MNEPDLPPDDFLADPDTWNSPVSGFERVAQAMAVRHVPTDPLERSVIIGLLPLLPVGQQRFLRAYYRQCRQNYNLTRATSRRAIAVQVVVEASQSLR